LIRLLKSWVRQHDEHNLRTGRKDDINWLLRELGLTEILFDAPPSRPKLPPDDEPAGEEFDETIDDSLFPLPVLPPEPFSHEEVSDRLDAIFEESATASDALEYLEGCGSNFVADAAGLCEDLIKPEEFNLFVPCLVQTRLALVPRGFREPELDFDRLAGAYGKSLKILSRKGAGSSAAPIKELFENCRQPFLAEAQALALFQGLQDMPPKLRPSLAAQLIMILTLTHMIDELDRSIRE
jgi:hypothetical protein